MGSENVYHTRASGYEAQNLANLRLYVVRRARSQQSFHYVITIRLAAVKGFVVTGS